MSDEQRASVQELISAIKQAGKAEKVVEFQYPYVPSVFMLISYASKQLLKQITEEAKESFFNVQTRQQEDRINDEKFNRAAARELVKGWREMKIKDLKTILAGRGEIKGAPDQDVPFDEELAFTLMDASLELQAWVINVATNVTNFSKIAEKKADELKNLA